LAHAYRGYLQNQRLKRCNALASRAGGSAVRFSSSSSSASRCFAASSSRSSVATRRSRCCVARSAACDVASRSAESSVDVASDVACWPNPNTRVTSRKLAGLVKHAVSGVSANHVHGLEWFIVQNDQRDYSTQRTAQGNHHAAHDIRIGPRHQVLSHTKGADGHATYIEEFGHGTSGWVLDCSCRGGWRARM
jgi:hypothetical protein